MTERPKYIHTYRDRHGKVRCYIRKKGRKIRIKAELGTDAFRKEYETKLVELQQPDHPTGPVVYFVRGGNKVKIGTTNQPIQTRLRAMQVGCPIKLHLIAVIPGDRETEKRIHARFAGCRLSGEWFDATYDLRRFIIDLRTNGAHTDG